MTRDKGEARGEEKLEELEARLRAANRSNRAKGTGRGPNPAGRRRVNYRRRLKEARSKWDEGDRAASLLLLESLDKDYPSVDSIVGRPTGGGRFGGGAAGGGDAGGGDAGGGGS